MAIFRYEAVDGNGKVLRGAMDAASAPDVARRLEGRGYQSVQVQSNTTAATAPAPPPAAAPPARPFFGAVVPPEELGLFFRQLASLVHAGFTVSSALTDLAPRTRHKAIGAAATRIAEATGQGKSLASEMARFPHVFAPHVVGLVAAGEAGGFLPFAFEEAALGAEQDAALRQGLWLPKLLVWQAVWSVLLLQPLFPRVFTEGLAAYGRVVLLIVLPLGVGLHLLAALAGWSWRQPWAARFRDTLLLRFPVTGRLARMRALASFTRVLRRLLLAGISPEPAFTGAARSVANGALADRLLAGVPIVRAGQGLDAAISATGLMEHDPLQLLVTGQRTGQWVEMLDRVTATYQEEAARAIDAAKAAQKRLGVLVTIAASGYVGIVATVGPMKAAFEWTDKFFGE